MTSAHPGVVLAVLWLSQVASAGRAEGAGMEKDSILARAITHFKAERWKEAYQLALPLAESGEDEAQRLVGNLFGEGRLGKADFAKARMWWERSARSGNVASQFNYGLTYLYGDGTKPDPAAGEAWLLEAAQGGHDGALAMLGEHYMAGSNGLKKQPARGYMLLRVAALYGDLQARLALGRGVRAAGLDEDDARLAKLASEAYRLALPCANSQGKRPLGEETRDESIVYKLERMMYYVGGRQGRTLNAASESGRKIDLTLRDMAIRLEALQAHSPEAPPRNAHVWVFYRKAFRLNGPEAVPVETGMLWDLARPGDQVEISDGVNSHVTFIHSIDRKKESIRFLDVWPGEFLLLPGRNAMGVNARTEKYGMSRVLVSITKAEYLRVVRGILTFDDADFIRTVFTLYPALESRPEVQLAVGSGLLRHQVPEIACSGTAALWSAVRDPGIDLDKTSRAQGIDRLAIGIERCREAKADGIRFTDLGSGRKSTIHIPELEKTLAGTLKPGYTNLDPDLVARLAMAKAGRKEYRTALGILERAIADLPENETLLFARAQVYVDSGAYKDALADLDRIIRIAEGKLNSADMPFKDANNVLTGESTGKSEMETVLKDALTVRAGVLLAMKRPERAVADASAILEGHPDDVVAVQIAIQAYQAMKSAAKEKEFRERLRRIEARSFYRRSFGVDVGTGR